jgi:predicted membrane channel-forming protein YqfA (hemolysin III family)
VARRQYRCTHGYLLFCISLVLTAMGSAYYHLAPDDTRQVWDRLPIALACVALLLDAWEAGSGRQHMPSTLVSMGVAVASVAWWWYGNQSGNGDLRPYLLLQVLPLLLVPLLQWAFRRPVVERCAFAVAIACYVAAKMLELADHAVLQALAVVSGHTLKHVFASIGAAIIIVFRRPSEMKSPL